MFRRKDRKIANLEAMVKNRDKIIKYQENKIVKLETTLSRIKIIADSNNCGNPEVYIRKIKELVYDYQSKN